VRERLEETSEAWTFRTRYGRLPLSGVDEIAPVLETIASAGGHGLPEEFRPILSVARAAEAVRRFLEPADAPRLASRRDALPRFAELLERARRLFAADGSVRDDASPRLRELRERLRRRRTEVSQRMTKLLEERRDALGDALLVQRNDRYCLPVLASARGRVPGIVHDRSGSGQTVFVEPMEVIEANNELALHAAEERREVERLLVEFGQAVLEVAPDLSRAVAALGELDALEARVEFGEISEGRIPEISDDGSWTLAGARHPLLDPRLAPLRRRVLEETRAARAIVPLDLDLPREKRLLVVSGPNAGGKTVVLKTAGLFSLLAQ
jgi:DNA mismatch repair protein MutS2